MKRPPEHPFASLPEPCIGKNNAERWHLTPCRNENPLFVPNENQCRQLWDKYDMYENIRKHSLKVARICERLAERAAALDISVSVQECLAAGLLHDLAKTYCLKYGGSHGALGCSWVLMETGNYAIAQGVLLHVHWPWVLPAGKNICCLPIFLIYADKRVMHDSIVTLEERFDDLIKRYGHTQDARAGINETHKQAIAMQEKLSSQLEWDLNEDSFA